MPARQGSADALRQAGGGASLAIRATPLISAIVSSYLEHVYKSHADQDGKWTDEKVQQFIEQVQGNTKTTPAAVRFLGSKDHDWNEFLLYMTSEDTAATLPWEKCDVSWPLSSYFISSSHNTYLSGNQLYGDSTTDAYTNVLKRGCRCVEIDVWDGNESASSPGSTSPGSDGEEAQTRQKFQAERHNTLDKLSDNLTARFERTSLGKSWERKHSRKHNPQQDAASNDDQQAKTVPTAAVAVAVAVEPRVRHGYTLTREVSFRDVCEAIRENAFTASDLPLIISLEVHCGPEQQAMMASIMREVWGNMLVAESEIRTGTTLPSPQDLRGKILIKVKYAPADAPAAQEVDSGEDERLPAEAPPRKPSKTVQVLSQLGIYTQAVTFKTWTQPEASLPTHVFSLAEKKFMDHREKHGEALFEHNRHYLLRAYPSGLRISSSNMMPTVFWAWGAQLVALNWQQTDEGMMLNEGMFAGTGGYVLKPQGWRPTLDSHSRSNAIVRKTLNLSITFLAAQNIPLPLGDKSDKKFHPYVKVEIHAEACHALPAEEQPSSQDAARWESEIRYKARTKTHKGANVDLERQKMSFHDVEGLVEELTFVRFTVRDDEFGVDQLAAWACVRLDRLGQGFRFVHLMDAKGHLTDGAILVRVEKVVDGGG